MQKVPKKSISPYDLVVDSLVMAAAETLDLAAKLEVETDSSVVEHAEAIDDCDRAAANGDKRVVIEFQVGLVPNGHGCSDETKTQNDYNRLPTYLCRC